MIYLLHGENEFEKAERLYDLLDGAELSVQDGEAMDREQLMDALLGLTLFGEDGAVVVRGISENSNLWSQLPVIFSHEIDKTVVLLESKLDKRTKTYKFLQKNIKAEEFTPLTDKHRREAVAWFKARAGHYGVVISAAQIGYILDRLGHDQLSLDNLLQQLRDAPEITNELLSKLLPMTKKESVLELFEAALTGSVVRVQEIVGHLSQENGEDGAYMAMGLIASQLMNLNALVLSGDDSARVENDFGVHPFVLKKLKPFSRTISRGRLVQINQALARADEHMKGTSVNPWLAIEVGLIEVAQMVLRD